MGTYEKDIWLNVEKWAETGKENPIVLPPLITKAIKDDFKCFAMTLIRYKFVGKMLEGKNSVLEVGCNVGFKTMMLGEFVKNIVGMDFSEDLIAYASDHFADERTRFICEDFLVAGPVDTFDAVVALDVIEHIDKENEDVFITNMCRNMHNNGVGIIGTPNITAAPYQSEGSRIGHINLYSADRLKGLMGKYFHNVFQFGMNDEVVHTGFSPMAHYIFMMGVGVKGVGKNRGGGVTHP